VVTAMLRQRASLDITSSLRNRKYKRGPTHIGDFLGLDVSVDAASWYSACTPLVHRVFTYFTHRQQPHQRVSE